MLLRNEIVDLALIQMENGSSPPKGCYDITSYNLRLGKEYCLISGSDHEQQIGDCSKGTGILRIPPFACVLVSTKEVVKLPPDIAGRWGLKIRPAMSGLVFQAGPQIQPGSHSRLFGLLFNLSSSERSLYCGQKLWSIDFERLPKPVPVAANSGGPILRMRDYTQDGLPTGSINEIYHEYRKLQRDVSSRRDLGVAILMAVITLLISLTVPVVVTNLVSNASNISRQQQQLQDQVTTLESRMASLQAQLNSSRVKPSNVTATPTP